MNQGQEVENEEDDDFGDFGGFEGAEPVPDLPVPQAQAAASPWAVLTTGSASGRPDLLCAQNRFPTYLDPSDISNASGGSADVNLNNRAEAAPPQAPVDLFNADFPQNANHVNQARIAENVLDGTLNVTAGANLVPAPGQVNGRLPDIGLGINENRLFGQAPPAASPGHPDALPINDQPPLNLPGEEVPAAARVPVVAPPPAQDGAEEENVANRPREPEVEAAPAEEAGDGQNAQQNAAEKSALQEQINSLLERNQALEEELRRSQEELASRQSRLQEMQARHEGALADMRSAGSEAVAVVVEQYKEQSQVLIAEQQEVAQRHLVETLTEQTKSFQDMLAAQQAEREEEREKERAEVERQITQALEAARQKQEEQFEAFLQAEREKQRKAVEEAVEAERVASEGRLQEAIAAQQEQARTQLEALRVDYSQQLEEERQSHEAALRTVREEEKELAKEQLSELGREERERRREAVQTALSEARQDTRAYIEEQRQADARVRRRHLASLDVFLESSRQQIALLLEAERPRADDAEQRQEEENKDS
ncbi:coiled-coil domain-containing protein 91 [Aplysia californica]|uniref:Coiled-coil domain-containing protein 91 n=1 Tax=Aplysia californica TaxID=6500 RepID=A0ABM0JQZ7_APLCA|nr:coiled-coil domain-containing protein 91 [Aplysia californica]